MDLSTPENIGLWKAAMFAHEPVEKTPCFLGDKKLLDIYDKDLNEVDSNELRTILSKTRTLRIILTLIAGRLGIMDIFHEDVVNGYLIGNRRVLEVPTEEEKRLLVSTWKKAFKPELVDENLNKRLVRKADLLNSLHHTSTVLATHLAEKYGDSQIATALNTCGIRYGIVRGLVENQVDVDVSFFVQINKQIELQTRHQRFTTESWLGKLKEGEFVLIHKGYAIQQINRDGYIEVVCSTNNIIDRYNQNVSSHPRKD